MRRAVFVMVVALAAAACGGTPSSNGSNSQGGGSSNTGAKVDCARVKADIVVMGFPGVQVLAQVHGQDAIDAIRSKQSFASTFDIDAFLTAVSNLHVLDSYHSPGLGEPKPALDNFTAAGTKLKAILDGPATVPQADIDAYNAAYPSSSLVTEQAAVSGAAQAAGCH